ncbi:hypothetical protein D3C74_362250 [compost metagenome]
MDRAYEMPASIVPSRLGLAPLPAGVVCGSAEVDAGPPQAATALARTAPAPITPASLRKLRREVSVAFVLFAIEVAMNSPDIGRLMSDAGRVER